MNYTLNQIQIFLTVVKTKSITKASELLNLTQPAVSIQLKNFQDQFKFPLTEVVGRKLYITDFGKEIAEIANRIIEHTNEINIHAKGLTHSLNGQLKISVVSTGKYIMPYFISDFLKENQGVELLMDVTNKSKVIESLERNEVDFSLVSLLPDNLKTEKIELLQNKLFLVSNKEKSFPKKKYDKKVLEDLPLIFREKGSGTRETMERFLKRNQIDISKKMELTSNEAVKQSVLAGFGCSIMPLIGIKNELQNGDLQIIPTTGLPIKSQWYLIWLKNKKHSRVATEFLNYIKREKSNIVKQKFDWYESY